MKASKTEKFEGLPLKSTVKTEIFSFQDPEKIFSSALGIGKVAGDDVQNVAFQLYIFFASMATYVIEHDNFVTRNNYQKFICAKRFVTTSLEGEYSKPGGRIL